MKCCNHHRRRASAAVLGKPRGDIKKHCWTGVWSGVPDPPPHQGNKFWEAVGKPKRCLPEAENSFIFTLFCSAWPPYIDIHCGRRTGSQQRSCCSSACRHASHSPCSGRAIRVEAAVWPPSGSCLCCSCCQQQLLPPTAALPAATAAAAVVSFHSPDHPCEAKRHP